MKTLILIWTFSVILLLSSQRGLCGEHEGGTQADRAAPLSELPPELACSTLDYFIQENGGHMPLTLEEWEKAFSRYPGVTPAESAFSDSRSVTDLLNVRTIYGSSSSKGVKVNGLNIAGNLAVARGKNKEGLPIVEFITRGADGHTLYFGTIDRSQNPPVKIEPLNECVKCHRGGNFLMTVYPWNGSTGNLTVLYARVWALATKYPQQYYNLYAEMERIRASAGRDPRTLIAMLEKSPIVKAARYEGVPIYRHTAVQLPDDPLSYGKLNDIGEIFNMVSDGSKAEFARHLFEAEDSPEKRGQIASNYIGSCLSESHRTLIEPNTNDVTHSLGLIDVDFHTLPSNQSAVIYDFDHVTNTFSMPDALPKLNELNARVFDTRWIQATLAYNQRRLALQQGGQPTIPPTVSPMQPKMARATDTPGRDPRHSQDRGLALSRSFNTDELDRINALGLTKSDTDYLESVLVRAATEALKKKYGGVMKIPEGELRNLELEAQTLALFSPPMKALYQARRLPSRDALKMAYLEGLHGYFSSKHKIDFIHDIPKSEYTYQPQKPCPKLSPSANLSLQMRLRCLRCHGNTTPLYQALSNLDKPYDKLDAAEKKWRDRIYQRVVQNEDMPPARESEHVDFAESVEGKALVAALKAGRPTGN